MGSYLEKKEVKKALEEAKRLEKEPEPILSREKEAEIQKEMVSLSEKLKSLLKPAWFVKDAHRGEIKSRKRAKQIKAVKKSSAAKAKSPASKPAKMRAAKRKKK